VLGDAGILLDPADVTAWSAAIVKVVNDEHLRAKMAHDGRVRAASFTWERTARLTLDVYRQVARR
jgi:glycosyltransferase involved in cell wall biosynthesis